MSSGAIRRHIGDCKQRILASANYALVPVRGHPKIAFGEDVDLVVALFLAPARDGFDRREVLGGEKRTVIPPPAARGPC
jgi:hypothetical protein